MSDAGLLAGDSLRGGSVPSSSRLLERSMGAARCGTSPCRDAVWSAYPARCPRILLASRVRVVCRGDPLGIRPPMGTYMGEGVTLCWRQHCATRGHEV